MFDALCLALLATATPSAAPERFLEPIPLERVKFAHRFFVERMIANKDATIPACLKQCEDSGRIANFRSAAGGAPGKHNGAPHDDADVYKVIEGIGWTSVHLKDEGLIAKADAIVDAIVSAQRPDGYLNTFVQLAGGDKRFQDLKDGRELWCAGHLIEAGIAYARGTGKTKLLDAGKKFAELIEREFGPGKQSDVCGHPGIELALVHLCEHTGEERWLKLAQAFVDRRGDAARKERWGELAQDHAPLREQKAFVGEVVRACNLYAGAAACATFGPDASLVEPLKALWDDAWTTKSYVTGGLGSAQAGQGIARAFDLPNATAYCETCAGIALVQWSQRMLLLTGDSKYGDAIERVLYNQLAGAANLAGDRFFRDQPLESDGGRRREPWFQNACCPTNLARFWPQLPGLVFAQRGNTLYQLQLFSAEVDVELAGSKVHAKLESELPNAGRQSATITCDKQATMNFKLRRPGWNATAMVKHDLKEIEHELHEHEEGAGWVPFERGYEFSDGFMIHFLAPVRRVKPDERVAANQGRVALMRGPLVYCLEGHDNAGDARALVLPPEAELKVELAGTILGGTRVIRARGKRVERGADGALATRVATLTAIPYHLWANRDASDMVVWIPESPALAVLKDKESGGR